MSTPYESLAQLAHERVAHLTGEVHHARLAGVVGAAADFERLSTSTGDRPARPLPGAAAPIRRLLPIRLP